MKKEKIIELKIGDYLYNYQAIKPGFLKYKVIGLREYENSKLYEIECCNCKNHPNCRLLVSQVDNLPAFRYVSMLNDNENDEQYYWHNSTLYYLSKKECRKSAYKEIIKNYQEKKETLKKEIESLDYKIKELESLMEMD